MRPARLASSTPTAVAAGLALALFACPASAAAATHPGDGQSAIDAYVEALPTAGGPVLPSSSGPRALLPPSVVTRIEREGSQDAARLEEIATSPRFAAPSDVPSEIGVRVPPRRSFAAALASSTAELGVELVFAALGAAVAATAMLMRRRRRRLSAR